MTSALWKDKISLVQFLDFVSISILLPSVPPTVLKYGGTLFHLGCLMSISTATRMISTNIYNELLKISGKQQLLKYSLIASTILNAALLLTYAWQGMILNRILFFFVYQAPMLCAQLASKDAKDQSPYKNPHNQRTVAALIGCAIVGSLIDHKGGFYMSAAIATAVSGAALAIVLQLKPEEKEKEKLTLSDAAAVIPKSISNIVKTVRNTDIHFANWDALVIKSLLVPNATVVFTLFVVMIIFVFRGNGFWVCTTGAYQTVVIYLIGMSFNQLKSQVDNFASPKEILEKSALICTICAIILSFAPTYSFYLFMFIPLAISRTFIEHYFIDVFEIKQNQNLGKDIKTTTVIAEIVGPLFIGILYYMFTYNGYRILAITPIAGIYYIVKNKKYKIVTSEKNSEKKKESDESSKDK